MQIEERVICRVAKANGRVGVGGWADNKDRERSA